MDSPSAEIELVIRKLVQGSPPVQQQALEKYFTPTAEFVHPFCRTGSSGVSRWYILQIYRWYKIMSPKINMSINSISFDEPNKLLYVSMHQDFKIWCIPFYHAPVSLTTVLTLTNDPHSPSKDNKPKSNEQKDREKREREKQPMKWYIQKQNDLYQTNEFVKFVIPFHIGTTLVLVWHFSATFMCILCALMGYPMTLWMWNQPCGEELVGESDTAEAPQDSRAPGNHALLAADVGHDQ